MSLTLLKQSLMLAAMLPSATAFGVSMEPSKRVFFRGVLDKKNPLSSAGQGATPKPRGPTLAARLGDSLGLGTARPAPMGPKDKLDLGIPLSAQEKEIYIAQLNAGLYSKAFNNQLLLGVILVPSVTLILASTALEAKYLTQTEMFNARVEVARLDARVDAESRLYQLKNAARREASGQFRGSADGKPTLRGQPDAQRAYETRTLQPCAAKNAEL